MAHEFKRETYTKKRQAKIDLEAPHSQPNSVPNLRARVYELEKVVGIKITTT